MENIWGKSLTDKSPFQYCMAPKKQRDGAPVLEGPAFEVLKYLKRDDSVSEMLRKKLLIEEINLETLEFTTDGNTYKTANHRDARIILYRKQGGGYECTASKSV